MPGSTGRYRLPYPLPTDQVSAGASDIRALAEALDAALAILGKVNADGTLAYASPGSGLASIMDPAGPGFYQLSWATPIATPLLFGSDLGGQAAAVSFAVLSPTLANVQVGGNGWAAGTPFAVAIFAVG
jgi:hypothetical protein